MVGRAQRWHHRPGAQAALAWLAASYIRLLHATSRAELRYPPATAALLRARTPFIGAFWHGRMLLMRAALAPESVVHILISEHRDGVLIARALADLGIQPTAAEVILPTYLDRYRPGGRFNQPLAA